MAREFKFRAWNKSDNVMQSWESLRTHSLFQLITDERLTLMQYTGLKDKNGKEIYEGDFVRLENENGDVGLVLIEWDVNEDEGDDYWVGLKGKFIKNVTDEIYDDNGLAPHDWTGEPEVIGNIWENPELLEAK